MAKLKKWNFAETYCGDIVVTDSIGFEHPDIDPSATNPGGDMFTELNAESPYDKEQAEKQCVLQNDQLKRNKEYITIDAGFLEHLLNCLANQKGTALNVKSDDQDYMDKAWSEGMDMLKLELPRNMRAIKT